MTANRTMLVGVTVALVAFAGDLNGQYVAAPAGVAVGVGGGVVSLSDSIQDFNFGGGGEAFARYTFNGLQLAAGGGYGVVGVDNLSANRKLWTVFADMRLLLNTEPGAAPYIGGRLGYAWSSVDVSELNVSGVSEAKANGWMAFGEFGVLIPLSLKLAIDSMLTFGVADFADIELNTGEKLPDSSHSGVSGSLRVAIVYSFSGY